MNFEKVKPKYGFKLFMEKLKKILLFNIERAILNNITRVVIYLILILSTIQIVYKILEIGIFITIIGAIIAFWYGYKKYERDKELEMINLINFNKEIEEIIIDWNIKQILYEKGYISEYLWEIIEEKYNIILWERVGIIGDLQIEVEKINEIGIDNGLIINSLLFNKKTRLYFTKIHEQILAVINSNIKFYDKIKSDDYHGKIFYFKILKREIEKFKTNQLTHVI